MKTIGITGGVGSGKSAVLEYIAEKYNALVIYADKLAYELESPGHICYDRIVELLGRDILDSDGFINKIAMAEKIFADNDLLREVNDIVHPAVKDYITDRIRRELEYDEYDYFVLEAALLIEEKYYEILDEFWYVRADEDVRRQRLRSSRGYSDEKIDSIMDSQLDDQTYMKYCKYVIDNSESLTATYAQVDALMD